MTKMWIDLDDEALADAAQHFATTSPSDTVNAALAWAATRGERAYAPSTMIDVDEDGR